MAFLFATHLFPSQYLFVHKECFKNKQPSFPCNNTSFIRKCRFQACGTESSDNDRVPCTLDLTTPLNINANCCTELQLISRLELLANNAAKLMFTELFPCSSLFFSLCFVWSRLNGAIGMLLALELKKLGYQSRIVLTDGTKYHFVYSQVQNQVSILDFIPSTMEYYADFVVDAIFGVGQQGLFPREPFDRAISVLSKSKVPVVSLDVPSGCTVIFGFSKGIIPFSRLQSMRSPCILPPYPNNNCYVLLDAMHQTSPQLTNWGKAPGEIYGQGKPMPTLFSEPRISRWIDPEEENDFWDELD
ncbi:NAD(P)H-hydrate epimerase [Galdieria sulphuraria]|nr:NAD(P)H-hydrate epimerase [Galdieria sulphuraria]